MLQFFFMTVFIPLLPSLFPVSKVRIYALIVSIMWMYRVIMLFFGKPIGRSLMISNVNVNLGCSSVSSPMPAIWSCCVIYLRHTLLLSDCPTSFTLLLLTLPLLLMLYTSTLSAIPYSAAIAGILMSATSSSSAHESTNFRPLAINLLPSYIFLNTSSLYFRADDCLVL